MATRHITRARPGHSAYDSCKHGLGKSPRTVVANVLVTSWKKK